MSKKTDHVVTIPLTITVSLGQPAEGAVLSSLPAVGVNAVLTDEGQSSVGLGAQASDSVDASHLEGLFGGSTEEDEFEKLRGRFALDALGSSGFVWNSVLNAALCSTLAYQDAETVESQVVDGWGFERCRVFSIDNTECFVASTADAIVVSFRGTQEVGDWLTNLNFAFTSQPFGAVHRGFFNGFELVRVLVEGTLREFGASRKKVVITGHSLGGALATVAAATWHGKFPISGVYTFGQPAVGFSGFRSFIDVCYPESFHRFVNDDDVVPRVPPGYRHVGQIRRFDSAGSVALESTFRDSEQDAETPTMSQAEFERMRATLKVTRAVTPDALADTLNESINVGDDDSIGAEGFFPSVADHSMNRYLAKIAMQLD